MASEKDIPATVFGGDVVTLDRDSQSIASVGPEVAPLDDNGGVKL